MSCDAGTMIDFEPFDFGEAVDKFEGGVVDVLDLTYVDVGEILPLGEKMFYISRFELRGRNGQFSEG